MDVMQFTQALSRIWVLETRLLDKSKIERMLESSTAEDALKILGETEYANVMLTVKRATDYEDILSTELKRIYNLINLIDLSILLNFHKILFSYLASSPLNNSNRPDSKFFLHNMIINFQR